MTDIEIRRAVTSDIPVIVAMLADDELGATRESPDDLAPYYAAFARLAGDPNQFLMVAVRDGEPVGTLSTNGSASPPRTSVSSSSSDPGQA